MAQAYFEPGGRQLLAQGVNPGYPTPKKTPEPRSVAEWVAEIAVLAWSQSVSFPNERWEGVRWPTGNEIRALPDQPTLSCDCFGLASDIPLRGTKSTLRVDEICELVLADAGSNIHSSPEDSSVKSVVLRLPVKLR